MSIQVRRLGLGDEAILAELARDDPDFDIAERGEPLPPLGAEDAAAYLADEALLHWIAVSEGVIAGHLSCQILRKRAGAPKEVLLYEIGVRSAFRRRGIGRTLIDTMQTWKREGASPSATGHSSMPVEEEVDRETRWIRSPLRPISASPRQTSGTSAVSS